MLMNFRGYMIKILKKEIVDRLLFKMISFCLSRKINKLFESRAYINVNYNFL